MTGRRPVAAAQTVPRPGDVRANVREHVRLTRAAADAGAGLVLFPELSLIGYELALADDLAFTRADSRLDPLHAIAGDTGATLVAGAPVRVAGRLRIAALAIAPGGTVSITTKQHLGAFPPDANEGRPVPPAEATVFGPGEGGQLVRAAGHAAAVAICADTGRSSHAEHAAERGASLYLASLFVPPAEVVADHTRLAGYAERHAMAVVMANFGGPSGGMPGGGRSALWSSAGELLVSLPAEGAGVAVATPGAPDAPAFSKML